MFKNLLKALFTLLGVFFGWFIGGIILNLDMSKRIIGTSNDISFQIILGIISILFAIIFYILSPIFVKETVMLVESIEKAFSKIPPMEIILGAIGGLIALTIFFIITNKFLDKINGLGPILGIIGNVIAFFLGANVASKKRAEVENFFSNIFKGKLNISNQKIKKLEGEIPKVLDTSVIIDGRIFDICKTGFVEGPLIIPSFVLEELRHIADSSDSLKRNRGRRGLDILNKIQKELDIAVKIWDKEVKEASEVDVKLLMLAKQLGGKVVTNDYNLNKVAEFQGVAVLNINELANAVKPILLPGEELRILVSKVGKEQNQGLGYLDDGTMIVIENGKKLVNKEIDAVVNTVLQTAAGRMIFARPKDDDK